MSENRDDDFLELGYEPGKRVEFVYDETPTETAAAKEGARQDFDEEESARPSSNFLHRFWPVLLAAAVLVVALVYVFGKEWEESKVEESSCSIISDENGYNELLPLSQQYQVYEEQLKTTLLNRYPEAVFLEYSQNADVRPGTGQIVLMDLDADGVAPEAIYLTEYISDSEDEQTFDTARLCVSYIDTAGQVQTCECSYSTERVTVELLLQAEQGDGARVILYQEGEAEPDRYSRIFRYDLGSTWGLTYVGGLKGRIDDQMPDLLTDEAPVFELDGLYQVRQSISYQVEEQSGTGYKVFSYNDELYNVGWDGKATAQVSGDGAYYTLELAPWWDMRRVLLALMPEIGMSMADETDYQSYLQDASETVLHGSQAHIIGGFEGTDLYLVETDYGEQGFLLLTDPFQAEHCVVTLQGLPFYEVFAAAEEEENGGEPKEISEELCQELDLHITQPGVYDAGDRTYVWADLNGDGWEHRFNVTELMGDVNTRLELKNMQDIYNVGIRLVATDLDPLDHRMELGVSLSWSLKEGAVEENSSFDGKTSTCLYFSPDGETLVDNFDYWQECSFQLIDEETGEALYGDGTFAVEYFDGGDWVTRQVTCDGQRFKLVPETVEE
jgi:hypothetical protein